MSVIVLHSTEGSTLQGAVDTLRANNSMSHEVWDIDTGQRVQLVPLDRPARTLVNLPGGVETNNRGGVIQVEIVGWASRSSRDQAGATVGPIMDELDDDQLRWLGAQVRDLCAQTGTPFEFPLPFLAYPDSYGANGVRMNFAQWLSVHGVVGHQHVPENAHGDPGALDVARMAALTAPTPEPSPDPTSEEDDMKAFQLVSDDGNVHTFVPGQPAINMGGLPTVHGLLHRAQLAELINAGAPVPAAEVAAFIARWNA